MSMFNRNAPPPDHDEHDDAPEAMPTLQPERTYKVRWMKPSGLERREHEDVLTCRRIEQVGALIIFTNVIARATGDYDVFLVRAIPVSSIVDYEEVMLHGMSIAQSSALVVG